MSRSEQHQSLPVGIKIICVFATIGALGSIFSGIQLGQLANQYNVANWVGLLSGLTIILGFAMIPMVYGLWKIESWGWKLAMMIYTINVLSGFFLMSKGLTQSIISVVIGIIIMGYLYSKRDLYLSRAPATQNIVDTTVADSETTHRRSEKGTDSTPGTPGSPEDTSNSVVETGTPSRSLANSGEVSRGTEASDRETNTHKSEPNDPERSSPGIPSEDSRSVSEQASTDRVPEEDSVASDGDDGADVQSQAGTKSLDDGPITPEQIMELGDTLPDDELPGDVATVLENHKDSDDPEIRLAICRVCAEIDDERADSILKQYRIDGDDRVVSAALDGLR